MKERWKKIEGYENYSVSSMGRVRHDKTGKMLKQTKDKDGYLQVVLYKEGEDDEGTVEKN